MHSYALDHLSDTALLRDLSLLVVRERQTTAAVLAHIAEVDARRLYVPAGYSSMHAYCVGELKLSDDAASKRIQAARAGRRFPAMFEKIFEGALHLSGACLLAPFLTEANADELMKAAEGRRKYEIEAILARRFAPASLPVATLRPVTRTSYVKHAPGHVDRGEYAVPDLFKAGAAQTGGDAQAAGAAQTGGDVQAVGGMQPGGDVEAALHAQPGVDAQTPEHAPGHACRGHSREAAPRSSSP